MFPTGLPPSSGGDYTNKIPNSTNLNFTTGAIAAGAAADLLTITGKGFISEITISLNNTPSGAPDNMGLEVLIDGTRTLTFYSTVSAKANFTTVSSQGYGFIITPAASTVSSQRINSPLVFKTSIVVRLRNVSASSTNVGGLANIVSLIG